MSRANARMLLTCCLLVVTASLPSVWATDLAIAPAGIEVTPRLPVPGTPYQPFPVLVEMGKPVDSRATIANRGDGPAVGTYAEIDVNRYPVKPGQEPVWVGIIAPLRVGAHQKVTLPFAPGRRQAPAFVPEQTGVYIAVVNVDPELAIHEDRRNNIAGIPLQVVPCSPTLALPDLICSEFDQLLVTTADEPTTHHRDVRVGQEVRFLVSCRLEGAGPYCGYVEVEVNPRGAKPGDPPLWHGVFSFVDLKEGAVASGLARARPEDKLSEFWTPDRPGEYIIAAVADPGYQDDDLGCYLPRGGLIEPPGKDTFYAKETEDDAAKRYGNNAVFRTVVVHPLGQGTGRGSAQKAAAPTEGKPSMLALWVWNPDVLTQAGEQARLFALCQLKGIRLLFVDVGRFLSPGRSTGGKPGPAQDELAEFVGAAHQRGIKVHALDGDPYWAMAAGHEAAVARITHALEYNQAVPTQSRLDGFQFDIEPYLLPDFQTAKRESIQTEYLDLLTALCTLVNERQPDFELGLALPFWLDGESESSVVAWRERSQPFTFHAIEQLDTIANGYVAVMAYRDFTDGADGSIRHATDEAVYAHEHAKRARIFVGQETAEVRGDPEKITFFEEGSASLDKAIRELADAFGQYSRFAGVAIHHYDAYKVWFDAPIAQSAGSGAVPQPPLPVFQITKPKSGTLTTEESIAIEGLGGRAECVIRVFVQPRGMKRAYQQPGHATVYGEKGAWRFEACNLAGSGRTRYTSGQLQVYAEMHSKAGQVLAGTKLVTVRRKAIVITSPVDGWNARQRLFTVRGYAFGFRPGTEIQIIVQTDIGYQQDNPGIVRKDGRWESTGNVLGGYPVPYTHYVRAEAGDIQSNTVRIIKRGE